LKAKRVNCHHRTSRRIEEGIYPPLEPDGVGADITACGGVVVAVPVIEQAGFRVIELPRHAQVDGGGAAGAAVAEGIRRPRPDLRPARIGAEFRRAEVVGKLGSCCCPRPRALAPLVGMLLRRKHQRARQALNGGRHAKLLLFGSFKHGLKWWRGQWVAGV